MTAAAPKIAETPVTDPDALAMIAESEAELSALYAGDVRHAFSPDQLVAAGVVFFVGRRDGAPVGCGGLAPLDGYGELKRVFTSRAARGTGVAAALVAALEAEARRRGLPIMRLETGEKSPDALGLYAKLGYRRRPPFGAYAANPTSVFMEKAL